MSPALVLDVGERMFAVLLAIPFVGAFALTINTHPAFICVVASEMLGVIFILLRRPGAMATKPLPILLGLAGTSLPLLARPGGTAILPFGFATVLIVGGLGVSILAKLHLNRSFGLVAANRGVKVGGPYRFVRHPMYLGYMLNQVGFLLASFSAGNVLLYVVVWTVQIFRIREEESVLCRDPAYRELASRVPAKLVPGIF